VLENQRLLALDIALKETFARWWGAHKETIRYRYQFKQLFHIRFDTEKKSIVMQTFDRQRSPLEHLDKCITLWTMTRPGEWPYHFIHTLEGIQLVCRPGTAQKNCRMDNITA